MFKRTHVGLSMFLLREMKEESGRISRTNLNIGCVWPDMSARHRMKDHEFDQTFEDTKERIRKIDEMEITDREGEWSACRQIGIVLHYLADYFTCPHNPSYGFNIVTHGIYEGFQAQVFLQYLYSKEAEKQFCQAKKKAEKMQSFEELMSYIERRHECYLSKRRHSPKGDCRWIVEVCSVAAVFLFSEKLK